MSRVSVSRLRAETRHETDGLATPTPRLSWMVAASEPGWLQRSAEVELDGEATAAVDGRDSVLVAWPFTPIEPGARHRLRVRVTGEDGDTSDWSEAVDVRAAFLADGGWRAEFVGLRDPETEAQPALLRHEFSARGPVARATLFAAALGAYQVEINGRPVDDEVLKPGWTPYRDRVNHETTDVTALVRDGANAVGIRLAGAWYTEKYGFAGNGRPFYGEQPSVAAQLHLEYADGSSETVVTGPDWVATGEGPLRASGIYEGESYDARRELPGWAEPGFDSGAWSAVRVATEDVPIPTARISPAVRVIEERPVAEVLTSASGSPILDFGQNLVGYLRIRVSGPAGAEVRLRHAEVLEHGELGIRPLRHAAATDSYTLRGEIDEVWSPQFTFHGFRYAQIEGLDVDASAVTACVVHSDMERTGWFESSHELVDRLHENVVWGMRGNFLYLPTDCPQRDERLGWTGDIQVFSPAASFIYDTDAFLTSWLADLALEQTAAGDGIVPFIVPAVLERDATPAAAWGDAATVVPTVLYERFGDLEVVTAQYESMRGWVDHLLGIAGERRLWEGRFQFGDWLDPAAPPANPFAAKTDHDLVATAYLYRSTDLFARAAELLGRSDDARVYRVVAGEVKDAFLREFATDGGRLMSDAETAYAVAIMFGLTSSDEQRQQMGDRLAELVRANAYRIGTGFVGTPLVTDALTSTGHGAAAARMLTQTENPSWLYPVTMGATTIWERWDSMLEDGTINPGQMTSFNHYAFGAVADWLHRTVAGLGPAEPGYRTIRVAPVPFAAFEHASARHLTPYGEAEVGWRRESDRIIVSAVIPANTTAEVHLPDGSGVLTVGSGRHSWTVDAPRRGDAAGRIGAEASLADVVDDVEAYTAFTDALRRVDPEIERVVRSRTRWTEGRRLGEILWEIPRDARVEVDAALKAVNSTR